MNTGRMDKRKKKRASFLSSSLLFCLFTGLHRARRGWKGREGKEKRRERQCFLKNKKCSDAAAPLRCVPLEAEKAIGGQSDSGCLKMVIIEVQSRILIMPHYF